LLPIKYVGLSLCFFTYFGFADYMDKTLLGRTLWRDIITIIRAPGIRRQLRKKSSYFTNLAKNWICA